MDKTEERLYFRYLLLLSGGDFLLKKEDLTGMIFGKLTVIKMLYNYNGTKKTKCLCKCECGNECIRIPYNLKHSELSSCGCGKKEYIRKFCGKDINGNKYGRLLVLETDWDGTPPKVKCLCDCGKIVVLRKSDVQSLHTKSCGCLQSERASEVNEVDHTGQISDYGIKILKQSHRNDLGQWIWECECGLCGKHFLDLPARILNGHVRSCGCLKRSSNELYISSLLKELDVDFKQQYTFDDCKSDKNYPLYFDFAIFKNNRLFCLIEYDGIQHYHALDYFGGEEVLLETKKRDELKNNYCRNNSIPLFRFPYTMTNDKIKEEITKIIYP